MADLLGSILGSMEKPPSIGTDERKKAKAEKALQAKQQEAEKKRLDDFKQKIQKKIHEFIKDGTQEIFKLEPMDKVLRAIVHDIAEVAGLASFSFGFEEEDRYVMLWKKEFAPSDEELLAYRKGEQWDPEKNKELQKQRELEEKLEKDKRPQTSKDTPSSNYRDKYKHLIGDEAAKEAARGLVSNSQYGFVPSKNKQDSRTIEQVLADSRARKRQKVDHNTKLPDSN
ncbi:Sperm-associated antigen 7 [Bulinus truncatus]|nr:Sperm-associated antigen 7 [Bulinus truncatus]